MARRALQSAVAAWVCAAFAAAAAGQGASSFAVPKRFIADPPPNRTMKVYPGSGLNVSFSRDADIQTIDPDGTSVPVDKMRVDRKVHIAAVPSAYETVYASGGPPPPSAPGGRILASGVDYDGVTELMLHWGSNTHHFIVYVNGTAQQSFDLGKPLMGPLSMAAQGYPPPVPPLPLPSFNDVLKNPWEPGAKALQPASAVIFHGAIIVAGGVWLGTTEANRYELRGWGFAMSLDRGVNWSLQWDNTAHVQAQLYVARGADWCLRAAPIYEARTQSNPTSCSICCTDYVHRSTNPSYDAQTGRVFYARISRPNGQSSNWSFGANTTFKVTVFDFKPLGAPPPVKPLHHAHSCMATEWSQSGGEGVQLIVSIGDGRESNRFIRITSPDYGGDYTTAPWVIQDEYHGRADPAGQVSSESFQPVGAAFGANPGEVIWGSDHRTEWLTLMKLPTSGGATPDQARVEHLYGLATGFGKITAGVDHSVPLVFLINQPRPEKATGPLTAVYGEEVGSGSEPDALRVLYCPDSSKPREWAQVADFDPTPASPTAVAHAGRIYLGSSTGVKRTPIPSLTPATNPTLMAIRPVLVGPGGKNLVKGGSGCYVNDEAPEPPTTLTQLTPVTAIPPVWRDESTDPDLDLPAVPSLGNRALKVRTTRADSNGQYARARVSSDIGTSWNTLSSGGWLTGTEQHVRRFRGWVLDGSYNQVAPNKTNHLYLRLWDEIPGPLPAGAMSEYSCHDRWIPCTNISTLLITPGRGLGLRFNALTTGLDTDKEDNCGYIVVGEALDGKGSLPYPMAPEANGEDELLTIGNVSVTSEQSWSVKLAGMMPTANWDHYAARGDWNFGTGQFDSDRRWPLFTLWAGPNDWVEFSADCETKGFRLRVNVAGTITMHGFGDGKQIWLPDSPLLVAIGYSHTPTKKLYIGVSLGGDLVKLGPDGIAVPWSSKTFTELRFRGATGGYSGQGEVCEFRWIGGEIFPNLTLTNSTLPAAFTDLGFLYVP